MAANVPILITGNNIEVTPAIKDYVNKKFGKALEKVGQQVTKCDVHLTYDQNPAIPSPNHVEVTLFAKGATIRAHKNNDDMYASIDEVSDTVKRKLRKYKERIIDSHRKGKAEAKGVSAEEITMFEEFNTEVMEEMKKSDIVDVAPPDMSSIAKKSFDMEPISLEEAVLCLEYIDHDFYVFKNKDNDNKVQVIYNRKSGGIGVIEPE
jgi:putative sigma-54 modulation protein